MASVAILPKAPTFWFLASPSTRFFAVSLLCHFLLFWLWPKPQLTQVSQAPIAVTLAPQPLRAPRKSVEAPPKVARANPKTEPETRQAAKRATSANQTERETRREVIARKNSPAAESFKEAAAPVAAPAPAPRALAREPIPERSVIAERELPTVKQLLPSLTSSARDGLAGGASRIPLETKEPQYVTYFTAIKRAIDANWKYPELALNYGLQGRLIVEFEILESGQLGGLRLVRSSGSALLDEEAIRAIRAASPFAPIPSWIDQKTLPITARMEYHDGRVGRPAR